MKVPCRLQVVGWNQWMPVFCMHIPHTITGKAELARSFLQVVTTMIESS